MHNRAPHRTADRKVGSPDFCPSLGRLVTNKILTCNILATMFCAVAFLNFMTHEDIILESRFHIPRPTGMLRGFNDPLPSRLITSKIASISLISRTNVNWRITMKFRRISESSKVQKIRIKNGLSVRTFLYDKEEMYKNINCRYSM